MVRVLEALVLSLVTKSSAKFMLHNHPKLKNINQINRIAETTEKHMYVCAYMCLCTRTHTMF